MAPIETTDLTHRYGRVTALRDVSLAVPEGSVYALLGRNGAGKTTLLKVLTGHLRPTSGRAVVLGRDAGSLAVEDRQRIGYVAEGMAPPGWMTIGELEAYLAPLYPTWDAGLARELARQFELDPQRRIRALSRGQRLKVALLCALAPCPAVLFLDEPFTGMDVVTKDEIVRGVLGTAGRSGTTILVCSHDLAELEPLADHVGFLEEGQLLLSEPLERLYDRFARVEVTTAEPAAALLALPRRWHRVERAGRRLQFVLERDGNGASDDVTADIRRTLPNAGDVVTQPASLREIFVALVGGPVLEQEAER